MFSASTGELLLDSWYHPPFLPKNNSLDVNLSEYVSWFNSSSYLKDKGNYKHKGFVSADISSCSAPAITQQFTLRRLYCLHHFSRSVILSRIYLKLKVILFTWWCIYGSPGRTRGDTLALNLVGMNSERRCLAPELLWGPDSSLPRLSLRRLIKILQKPTAGFN